MTEDTSATATAISPRSLTRAGSPAGLLLDLLQAGRDPRVVTVASELHRGGRINFDDLTGARKYAPIEFYQQSKFANVLLGLEFDRRLRAAGSSVR